MIENNLKAHAIKEGEKTQFIVVETGNIELDDTDVDRIKSVALNIATMLEQGQQPLSTELLQYLEDEIKGHADYLDLSDQLLAFVGSEKLRPIQEVDDVKELLKFGKVLTFMADDEGRHSRYLSKGISIYHGVLVEMLKNAALLKLDQSDLAFVQGTIKNLESIKIPAPVPIRQLQSRPRPKPLPQLIQPLQMKSAEGEGENCEERADTILESFIDNLQEEISQLPEDVVDKVNNAIDDAKRKLADDRWHNRI